MILIKIKMNTLDDLLPLDDNILNCRFSKSRSFSRDFYEYDMDRVFTSSINPSTKKSTSETISRYVSWDIIKSIKMATKRELIEMLHNKYENDINFHKAVYILKVKEYPTEYDTRDYLYYHIIKSIYH